MRNNNNKGSRSNVNKHELVYGESSSNARDAPNACLSFVLLFTIFIIVVTQKLVLQQSKYVTAKCTETLLPPPCIQFSLNQPNIPWVDLQQQQNQAMQKQFYKKSCVRLITLLFKGTVGVILKDPWFIELRIRFTTVPSDQGS